MRNKENERYSVYWRIFDFQLKYFFITPYKETMEYHKKNRNVAIEKIYFDNENWINSDEKFNFITEKEYNDGKKI